MVQLLAVALQQQGPEFKSEDGPLRCFVLKCACSLQVLPQSNNITNSELSKRLREWKDGKSLFKPKLLSLKIFTFFMRYYQGHSHSESSAPHP